MAASRAHTIHDRQSQLKRLYRCSIYQALDYTTCCILLANLLHIWNVLLVMYVCACMRETTAWFAVYRYCLLVTKAYATYHLYSSCACHTFLDILLFTSSIQQLWRFSSHNYIKLSNVSVHSWKGSVEDLHPAPRIEWKVSASMM